MFDHFLFEFSQHLLDSCLPCQLQKKVHNFIRNSLAENNIALLAQISKLVTESAENLNRANAEVAGE